MASFPEVPQSAESATLRFYARTDDGDWTELRPVHASDPGSGVEVYATYAHDNEDFFLQASDIEGEFLGRLAIVHERPVLLTT